MPSEVSLDGRMKLRSLLDCFQNTAGLAVEGLEGTTAELIGRGYAWVLSFYEVDFFCELPKIDEEFTVKTYHDPSHGYNTLRMFHAENEAGKEFVRAKTSWLLVDIKGGKPVKPLAHLPEIMSGDVEDISPEFREIPFITRTDGFKDIEVGFHALDYNGHVNNAVYFEWVYDNAPVDPLTNELVHISALFRSGAKLGENIRLNYEVEDNGTVLFTVNRSNIKKPSAVFLLEWRSKGRKGRKEGE